MARALLFAAGCFGLVVATDAAAADTAGGPIPHWLRGHWVVTEVDEASDFYLVPTAEAKLQFMGQILTVEAHKLKLANEICTHATARRASATFRRLLRRSIAGSAPDALGLADRPGQIKHLDITCGHVSKNGDLSFEEYFFKHKVKLQIIRRGDDTIELPFVFYSFLVLHRQKPNS